MNKKIPTAKISEMWEAYKEIQNTNHVAKKCKVNRATVMKYLIQEKWVERLALIRKKANEIADTKQVDVDATLIRITDGTIQEIIKEIQKKKDGKKSDIKYNVQDLDRMVRLRKFLTGEPESKHEITGNIITYEDFARYAKKE